MANIQKVVNIIFQGDAKGLRGAITDINQGLELFEKIIDSALEPLARMAEGVTDLWRDPPLPCCAGNDQYAEDQSRDASPRRAVPGGPKVSHPNRRNTHLQTQDCQYLRQRESSPG